MSRHPETVSPYSRKIILDCLGVRIGEQRGGERFICSLIAEIASSKNQEFLLLVNSSCLEFVQKLLPPSQYMVIPISGKSRLLRMVAQMIMGPVLAQRYHAPLYVSSSVFPTVGFPCPTAAFLHDLLIYHFPGEYSRMAWQIRTRLLKMSLRTLSAVFTVSRFCRDDIAARFPAQANSIHIVHNGTYETVVPLPPPERREEILASLGLKNRKFVLSVLGGGTFKNQSGLCGASRDLIERGRKDIDIVAVGDSIRVFRELECPPNLKALGFVPDEVLAVLYAHARALIFPSLFEGFGLPVIEAQASRLPVICSDIPVFREVAGDGAVFADPRSSRSLADAVIAVVDSPDLQQTLVQKGLANSRLYTWRHSLEMFLSACESVTNVDQEGKALTTTSA